MSYHKENLKERVAEIAWNICLTDSWQKVNMRLVAEKAGVSTTAIYRHFESKTDLKAELIRRGFQTLNEGNTGSAEGFSSYGAHYIRFGLDYPHIYDLMFGNTYFEKSSYPDVEALSSSSFGGLVEGLKHFMPDESDKRLMIKAYSIWAAVHGMVGILRRAKLEGKETETLKWIETNLEEYLEIVTFS